MDHIFENANDQHIRGTYVYAKANDAYAYANAGKTVKINAATLEELFLRGIIVISGTSQYVPTSLKVASGVATITYVTADGTTATTAVLATLASEEYTAG